VGGFYYNTNGFPFHRLEDAIEILAELGFDGLALTPDVHHLDPTRVTPSEVRAVRARLEGHGLGVVIETGARFVLDPRRKHRPSLLDPAPEAHRRLDFLVRCVELAEALGAPVVSVWSGSAPPETQAPERLARLADGLGALCARAADRGVRVGFEPEPGMEIERADQWPAVRDAVGHAALGLTLDVGHCLATREGPPEAAIRAHAADLVCLQLDDHRPGVHDHLFFGEGSVDFGAVARAVEDVAFRGPLEVELSRHGAQAPEIAAAALRFLKEAFGGHAGRG